MQQEQIVEIEIDRIAEPHPSQRTIANQRRQTELNASVAKVGVIQSLLGRPGPDDDDQIVLVCGRRRLEAARQAGLKTVPMTVREMSGQEAEQLELIENFQREDLHPLDEMHAIERLIGQHAKQPEEVAAVLGKSTAWVLQRRRLGRLTLPVQKVFARDEIAIGVALQLARVPTKDLQMQALKAVTGDQSMQLRDVTAFIDRNYMMRLDRAPFSINDPQLVKRAGTCVDCPKQTGVELKLFADVEGPERCTDQKCWKDKCEAAWAGWVAQAGKNGWTVLKPAEARRVFPVGATDPVEGSGVVDIDRPIRTDAKRRTISGVLGALATDDMMVARDQQDGIHRLMHRRQAIDLLKRHGIQLEAERVTQPAKTTADERQQVERRNQRIQVAGQMVQMVADQAGKRPFTRRLLAGLVLAMIDRTQPAAWAKRRLEGKGKGKGKGRKVARDQAVQRLRKTVQGLQEWELRGMLVELALGDRVRVQVDDGYDANLRNLMACCGLKVKQAERAVAQKAAKRDEKPTPKKPATKKTQAKTRPTG